ncbi:right-handed parallel beta-helix repeat-containing protein [Paenibacillus shenyangensis]|uniref:right-handed parallel beta-helix repeat-containing protein n=1 Tax=Paenibacillus sp. A9 TaxID=1284352 RepID=UPI00037C1A25|nr:right-handed parallel beta-helix repeat-containing protein [Paenibacillus sp. A9]
MYHYFKKTAGLLVVLLLGAGSIACSSQEHRKDAQAAAADSQKAVYYVSPDGRDSQSGSQNSPWRTIQHAADQAVPGSTIYIRAGVYHEQVTIRRSGSAAAGFITFASYPGEQAILDGNGVKVSGLQGLIDITDASYVRVQDLEVRNYTTKSRDAVPIGIYVHGSGRQIQLTGNHVHHIANTATPSGPDLTGRDAHGIAVYGDQAPAALKQVTIDHNELHDLVLGSSESLVINGNVDGFAVTNNRIYNNDNIGIDLIGFEGISPDEQYDQARNGLVRSNRIYQVSSNHNPSYGKKLPNHSNSAGGIYVDGGKNSVIERNYSYDNDIGIEIASEHKGRSTSGMIVRSNLIYHNRQTGIAMGGYDEQRGSTTDSRIVNNTLYHNDTLGAGNGQLLIQYDTRRNVIRNNIMVAGDGGVLIYNQYTRNSGNKVDHNLYFSQGGSADSSWIWKGKEYSGLQAYRKGSGNDAHSLFANPQFVDAGTNDYHLQSSSPAVDTGYTDPGLRNSKDMDGQPRTSGSAVNMGAYE